MSSEAAGAAHPSSSPPTQSPTGPSPRTFIGMAIGVGLEPEGQYMVEIWPDGVLLKWREDQDGQWSYGIDMREVP